MAAGLQAGPVAVAQARRQRSESFPGQDGVDRVGVGSQNESMQCATALRPDAAARSGGNEAVSEGSYTTVLTRLPPDTPADLIADIQARLAALGAPILIDPGPAAPVETGAAAPVEPVPLAPARADRSFWTRSRPVRGTRRSSSTRTPETAR